VIVCNCCSLRRINLFEMNWKNRDKVKSYIAANPANRIEVANLAMRFNQPGFSGEIGNPYV